MTDSTFLRTGLSAQRARELLAIHGPNALPDGEAGTLWRVVKSVLGEPMFVLLLVAAGAYLVVGSLGEGLMMCGAAALTVGLVIVQENRSEHALAALKDLSSPRARVIRDGLEQRIGADLLVPGDLVLLGEGDRVPADIRLVEAHDIIADESVLTGESVPVRKVAADASALVRHLKPGGDDLPVVFSGTMLVRGHGRGIVERTGRATAFGDIGLSLATIESEPTRMQRNIARLVQIFGILALVVCVLVTVLVATARDSLMEGVLAGITLAISMVPEEFPMVLSIFLAIGAFRMTRHNVLARKAAVIESLGAATILCTDKTGTLTENRMRVRRLYAEEAHVGVRADTNVLPEPHQVVLEYAVLASRKQSFDPMERAVDELGAEALSGTEHLHKDWELEREYEISAELLAMSHVWAARDGRHVVACKGAPEVVAQLCRLDGEGLAKLTAAVEAMAADGLRVIAVAGGVFEGVDLPQTQNGFSFHLKGLVGFADPLRESARGAVAQAHRAGIKVAMITGDYPATALAIARDAGIMTAGGVLTGAEIAALDDAALSARLRDVRVFARVTPDQKLRLVQAFKANGEVVAMTGDGVNDAPALKAAHIGIAMGRRGTDVAREASGIVLTDDDFGSLVKGVSMGRRIFDNLRKALVFVTSIHIPIAGLALVPLLFGMAPILYPLQVVFLELIIDPTASIAFEADRAEDDIMERRPRPAEEPMFAVPQLVLGLAQGVGPLLASLAVNWLALRETGSPEIARTLAFVTVVFGILALIRANANHHCLRGGVFGGLGVPFAVICLLTMLSLVVVIGIGPVRELFHFAMPSPRLLVGAVAFGIVSVLWFELAKLSPRVQRIMGASA